MNTIHIFIILISLCIPTTLFAWTPPDYKKFEKPSTMPVFPVKMTNEAFNIPLILRGIDTLVLYANGLSPVTQPSSIFSRLGLKVLLYVEHNDITMTNMYRDGKYAFFRKTPTTSPLSYQSMIEPPNISPVPASSVLKSATFDGSNIPALDIILDMYVVREDFIKARPDIVKRVLTGIMQASVEVNEITKNKDSSEYAKMRNAILMHMFDNLLVNHTHMKSKIDCNVLGDCQLRMWERGTFLTNTY